jgi:hypothetical protein
MKCSLHQCKNTNFEAEQFYCGYKNYNKNIIDSVPWHSSQRTLSLVLLSEGKFCSGCESMLKSSSSSINEKTRWDTNGTNGPDTGPNSISVFLDWWTMEGNYSKYRGGKDQNDKTKESYWQCYPKGLMIKEF